MKTAVIIARSASAHQAAWGGAFAAGLRRHGWQASVSDGMLPADLLVVWGVRRKDEIARQLQRGRTVCVLERGYLGDRFEWTSVSFGGRLNGRAEFRGPLDDRSRFEEHFAHLMRPWERRDGYALLIGQVPGDMSIAHADITAWYADCASRLKAQGIETRFRPHPMAVKRGVGGSVPGVAMSGGTLNDALGEAGRCITFSSNTGVEAVMAGVPTVACDEGSMARDVAAHDVNADLVTPDRSAWAAALAWKQYTVDEMRSGFCWEMVA